MAQSVITNDYPELAARRGRLWNAFWGTLVGLILGGAVLFLLVDVNWANVPIHAAIEAVGGSVGILMALFLLIRDEDTLSGALLMVAVGLLSMGIVDIAHGMTTPGQAFVWLHSMAVLFGGIGFALVWLPGALMAQLYAARQAVATLVILAALVFGVASMVWEPMLPIMVVDGQFTTAAIWINIMAGIFNLLAVPFFATRYYRTGAPEMYLFLCMALLFGLSAVTFPLSNLWDGGWWMWHFLRLIAYLVGLWFIAKGYTRLGAEQKRIQEELRAHRDNLERVVEERTAGLEAKSLEMQRTQEYLQQAVQEFSHFAERVAQGDLTARLTPNGHDEMGQLALNLNSMVEGLGRLTGQIRGASANIASAAAEILAATTQQASGATEQSSAIAQTSTTIEEVKTIAQQTAQQATQLAQDSQQALQVARQGSQAVEETVSGMNQIRERVESIAQTILALSEQTQAIGSIIVTVSEIADQSNLLALNAAIEAARAGEQGKSFAVVAQQVRDLAERSKAATVQVQQILSDIQRAANNAVMVTEEGTKGVEVGANLASDAGRVIHRITAEVENGAQSNVQIAAAAQQQTSGIDQVGQALTSIQQATTQALASTRQAERSAQDLHSLAQSLQEAIAVYRLETAN
jgi:methyl-accepting chemotaxis protein